MSEKASKTPSPRSEEAAGTRKHSPWTAPRYRKKKNPGAAADDSHPLAKLPESPEGAFEGSHPNGQLGAPAGTAPIDAATVCRWLAGSTAEHGAGCMDEDLLVRLDGVSITSPAQRAASCTVRKPSMHRWGCIHFITIMALTPSDLAGPGGVGDQAGSRI